jgi:hypothetical protein
MADTDDDERTAELEPDHAPGEDDDAPGAAAAGADRRAKEWEAGADLTRPDLDLGPTDDEAEALREAELDQRAREQLEQDALDERERHDIRRRHDVNRAEAEVAEALRLARADEGTRDHLRAEADRERRLARQDTSRAWQLRDGAAGRDDPEADADRAKADRYQESAAIETNRANRDDATADTYSADARERRLEAARVREPEQPPAFEAVRNPPQQAPKARKNLKPRKPRGKELRNIGLGGD